jgi:DNA polymerase-3 subunit epsilon
MKSIPPFPHNKRILFFDTETSGLYPEESEMLQLSYIIVDGATWKVLKEANFYFAYPEEEWRVSYKAIEVNHLTKEFLSKQKITSRREALTQFFNDLYTCQLAVAHNTEFDIAHIETTAIRKEVQRHLWPYIYCTMKESTNICKLPFANGGYGYKWPKLEELAKFLHVRFNKSALHDSLADTRLTFQCFKRLHINKQLSSYVYQNNLDIDTPVENAEELFPHQEASTYLDIDAPNLIIHDELLATYTFRRKIVAHAFNDTQLRKSRIRGFMMGMGYVSPDFIDESYYLADAFIISRDITKQNTQILQQVSDFQRSHPDFRVFTLEAFLRHPEVQKYNMEFDMEVKRRNENAHAHKEHKANPFPELKENDDEIATYKFRGKKIMLYSVMTDLREWRRCNLENTGATSLERVNDDNQTADALIIDGTFYDKKYKDWKDALELQRTNHDFRVFTLSAFGKHYDKVIWPYIWKQIEKIPKGSLKPLSEYAP